MKNSTYYGILTADVRYDKNLKPMEKIMYCEITALSKKNGYCYASNSYFAELYEVHKNTVGLWINHLAECGYLRTEVIYKSGSREVQERRLYITAPVNEKNDTPQQKKCHPINKKIDTPINENIEDNITSINTTRRILKYTPTGEGEGMESKKEKLNKVSADIGEILEKYNELRLPEFDYQPENYILLKVYEELGAVKLFEALTLMSQSDFVKNNLSINAIFKIENLKKALNGNFKNKEKKGYKESKEEKESKEYTPKKKFVRPVYEDFTGDLIKSILNGTAGGKTDDEV